MDASLNKELQKLALEIRIGIVEEIQARGFGHIGGSLSLADALAVLYGAVMRYGLAKSQVAGPGQAGLLQGPRRPWGVRHPGRQGLLPL